jgi:hypothetical protein
MVTDAYQSEYEPIKLLKTEPAGIFVVDFTNSVLQHLPCFIYHVKEYGATDQEGGEEMLKMEV